MVLPLLLGAKSTKDAAGTREEAPSFQDTHIHPRKPSRLLGEGLVQLSLQLRGAVAVIAHWVTACANQPPTRAITPRRRGHISKVLLFSARGINTGRGDEKETFSSAFLLTF